ncbi:MAG: hypothetical protein ABSC11_02180 [Smithella sp.]|jgi:hypothetical protein
MAVGKTQTERYADVCIYFDGIHSVKCKAGISYNENLNALPCFKGNWTYLKIPNPLPDCKKRHFPTEAEVKAFVDIEKEINDKIKVINKILPRIKEEHYGEYWRGTEICPVCGGILHLIHKAINGHVHGECETKDCLSWME